MTVPKTHEQSAAPLVCGEVMREKAHATPELHMTAAFKNYNKETRDNVEPW